MKTVTLRQYAVIGAEIRLRELEAEIAEILAIFPELREQKPAAKRRMSADFRRKVSEGMRRKWAKRKAKKPSVA